MLQRKISQWGLEKRHSAPEMRAILRLARQRQAAGKESLFRIRGRQVDIEEVLRYFTRRGEDPNTLDVQGSPIPSTITVEKPSASPPPPIVLKDESELDIHTSNSFGDIDQLSTRNDLLSRPSPCLT